MNIEIDDLTRPAVHALLREHMRSMHALGPPESVHAFDLDGLRRPEVTVWTAWRGDVLLGCGALLAMSAVHGEVKSMRTPEAMRRTGAGRALLAHIIAVARARGYERLSLETGTVAAFDPAHRLYASAGFTVTGPFGAYKEDVNSVFMTLAL